MHPKPTTALVTGGARRIGAAISRALAQRGLAVVIHHGHSPHAATALIREIAAQGGEAHALEADLGDPSELQTLLERAEERLSGRPVTLLVNNAAIFERGDLIDTSLELWQRHLEINLTAPFLLTRDFARRLPNEEHGQIIQIIDQHADRPRLHYAAYSAAKSALWTLTRQAALELAPRIRVNAIGPGPILPAPGDSAVTFAQIGSATPLRRAGSTDDIISALQFLMDHDFVTGELIRVDGGEHLR
ncbi:3-oxoacyl-[acyl-carrier-protein] reductase [Candidatus Magnetaquicoccaceae bacterium FCR-1]|uniref:3-oxoacyl-[acyl-carrier-protein] reductase n=1 Tax=Candidatus Magnetaquiglobus chichijimensis TaxID=3141448 RepID=A0ABQ0C4R3_9PROT